ncbi:MAG: hypothetical protein HOQ00_05975 [Agromyces sp.]|nr:hypothetical protein [Agromyces sp.]
MTVSAAPHEPTAFDVREFARTAQGSLRDELDLAAIAAESLPPEVARTLAALAALEGATMAHLRNVLVTSTHKDARVTAFLVTWAFEKYWIADALRAIVAAATDAAGAPSGTNDARADDALHPAASAGRGPVRRALAGFVQGRAVVGAHLALGYVDDRMLRGAYLRMARASANEALTSSVTRILRVKERHTAFFAEEAGARLGASPRAARLARRELRRTRWPLGSPSLAPADRGAFAHFAFGSGSMAEELRHDILALPGMDARTAASVTAALATLAARPAA